VYATSKLRALRDLANFSSIPLARDLVTGGRAWIPTMDTILQDVKYAARTFGRQPAFALTAILALALGIGANTAVFSVVYAVLVRPLPYPDDRALIYVHDTYPAVSNASISAAKYVALRERNRTLEALGAVAPTALTLTGQGQPEQVPAATASADLFVALRVAPFVGRWYSAAEDQPGADLVIVLSHNLWQRRFGGAGNTVGSVITVDGQARTVVGVMPPGFAYPANAQAWIPAAIPRNIAPAGNFLRLVGRMKPNVTVDRVQVDLADVSAVFNQENTLSRDVKVWPLRQYLVTSNRQVILVLQGAVAFVLLIACANVANLLLARSVSRQRELAIRAAIGAGRTRIVRLLLTECVLLGVLGGTVGILLASWLLRLFLALAPTNFPQLQAISIDTGVLAFTLLLAMVTGLVFGMAPAWRGFRTDPNDSLRNSGARAATSGRSRGSSRVLVIAEVAVALVLVIGAGLMVKSLLKMQHENAGFRADGLVTFEMTLPAARYAAPAVPAFFDRALDDIRTIPGVESVGAISYLPMANFGFNRGFTIEGRPPFPRDTAPVTEYRTVSPGYFSAMGIPIQRGREFTPADIASGRPVVVINQVMASNYWPDSDPVGGRLTLSDGVAREIVGVAGAVRSAAMNTPPVAEVYDPMAQSTTRTMGIVVRTGAADADRIVPAIRSRLAALDAAIPLVRVRSMQTIVDASSGTTRLSSVLTSVFALVAGLLAAVGIYSLIAYSVASRTREIGIRVALGADRRTIVGLILGEALMLSGAGVALGLIGAAFLTTALRTMLYEVSPTDPVVMSSTCAGLIFVAMLASLVPALRAMRVDPAGALRSE
jgi:putative ABC transport system permease protein